MRVNLSIYLSQDAQDVRTEPGSEAGHAEAGDEAGQARPNQVKMRGYIFLSIYLSFYMYIYIYVHTYIYIYIYIYEPGCARCAAVVRFVPQIQHVNFRVVRPRGSEDGISLISILAAGRRIRLGSPLCVQDTYPILSTVTRQPW